MASTVRAGRRPACEDFITVCRSDLQRSDAASSLHERPATGAVAPCAVTTLHELLARHGFDATQHERVRADLQQGRIGVAQNRLPPTTVVEDVADADVEFRNADGGDADADARARGRAAIGRGEAAVVTLAAGAGSRWTQGDGTVKALTRFCRLGGQQRSFLDVHVAKTRATGRSAGVALPHVVTTSSITHEQIADAVGRVGLGDVSVTLSPSRFVGLRLVPMTRDLRVARRETRVCGADEASRHVEDRKLSAAIAWAEAAGEGSDYADDLPQRCLYPLGHWYEIPNMLRNGVLRRLLAERPQLRCLFLHNIDTVGADLDPALLGRHLASGACLTYEVIPRRIEDRGGGLARVNGRPRLVEGLAMPREEDEFKLRFYNTLSTWIDIDRLLGAFGLGRGDLADDAAVAAAVRGMAAKMPTYVTLKDVKRRWGHGQEDVLPVAQFEKLWGDMTALPELDCRFVVVPRHRGQQLKDVAQLDGWLRDGSAAAVERLCAWE